MAKGEEVGEGRSIKRKRMYVNESMSTSRLEEDLRNTFIIRGRFTAELVKLYFTSNNTSSKQEREREQVQVGSQG